jgi:hypothetical protein
MVQTTFVYGPLLSNMPSYCFDSLEVFTKTKSDHRHLQRAHFWGCPVFVLDPRLQVGRKIPQWNRRARLV